MANDDKEKKSNHKKAADRTLKSPKDKRLSITNEEIAKLYKKKGCNMQETCDAIGINRLTFYRWREADPELERMLHEAVEGVIDFTESQLLKAIKAGDVKAIIFFLKTKGKHRGYVETAELIGNIGAKLRPLTDEELEELKKLNK